MAEELDEEEEALAEEAEAQKTIKAVNKIYERYKALSGLDPSELSLDEVNNRYAEEMERRGLRPYKL